MAAGLIGPTSARPADDLDAGPRLVLHVATSGRLDLPAEFAHRRDRNAPGTRSRSCCSGSCRRETARRSGSKIHGRSAHAETVQVTEFEDELNALARDCGLHRVRIQAAEPQRQDRVTTVTFTLEAGGEYPALCGFLDRLQSSSRLCPLSRLKVTRPSPDARSAGN